MINNLKGRLKGIDVKEKKRMKKTVEEKKSSVRILLVSDQAILAEAEKIITRRMTAANQGTEDCLTTSQVADMFGMDVRDMYSFLRDMGILAKTKHYHLLTEKYQHKGLVRERLKVRYNMAGEQRNSRYLVWTEEGVRFIKELLS